MRIFPFEPLFATFRMGRIENFFVPAPHFCIFCIKICRFPVVSGRMSDFSPSTPRFYRAAGHDTDIFFLYAPQASSQDLLLHYLRENGAHTLFFAHTPHSNMYLREFPLRISFTICFYINLFTYRIRIILQDISRLAIQYITDCF